MLGPEIAMAVATVLAQKKKKKKNGETWEVKTEMAICVSDESLVSNVYVNLPAVKRRAETLGTRRTVKKQWQVRFLLTTHPSTVGFFFYRKKADSYLALRQLRFLLHQNVCQIC